MELTEPIHIDGVKVGEIVITLEDRPPLAAIHYRFKLDWPGFWNALAKSLDKDGPGK